MSYFKASFFKLCILQAKTPIVVKGGIRLRFNYANYNKSNPLNIEYMQKNQFFKITAFIFSLTFLMTGCEPHRIEIQQGNKLDSTAVSKLKTGMNRKQVAFLLGSPLLTDPFHKDQWDYIYYLKSSDKTIQRSRLTVFFSNNKLIKIDDSAYTSDTIEKETN